MEKAGIDLIDARSEMVYPQRQRHPVIFSVFAKGYSIAGQGKAIVFIPGYRGHVEADLDKISGRSSSEALPPSGFWLRRIEGDWYLEYDAS